MKNLTILTAVFCLLSLTIHAQKSSLPVTITAEEGTVKLEWNTATETNTSYFLIESSETGQNFQIVGRVKAEGYSLKNTPYAFEVPAQNGAMYYRITLVGMDGQRTSSEMAAFLSGTDPSTLVSK